MPTELLPLGPPTLLKSGVAYALPAVKATVFSDAAATLSVSNTLAFTASAPLTLTAGVGAVAGGGFIKASADALITLKRD
jgi:hypothetical protein